MRERPSRMRSIIRCFSDVGWLHRYLIITLSKVNFAKDLAPSYPGRKIQHVGQRIRVQLRDQVEAAEISAWPPKPVLLHHHVWRAGPWRGRTLHYPLSLQLLELRFGCLKFFGVQPPKLARYGRPLRGYEMLHPM